MTGDFLSELERYKGVGDKALAQVPDAALNIVPAADANSVAMLVRHISGNLTSRFTDFLTTDGEKPWRDRDREFDERSYTRADVESMWEAGWKVALTEIRALTDRDLSRTVSIRGQQVSVHSALCRALSHIAYHIGQIVLLARRLAERDWEWISIPKGQSETYNRDTAIGKKIP